jgi:hypothetical protein
MRFLIALGWVFAFFLTSCDKTLDESRATELVRLHYKQLNADPSNGKWYLNQVLYLDIKKLQRDTFIVAGRVQGFHAAPAMVAGVATYTQSFSDSFQFKAFRVGKTWIAKSWKRPE